MCDPSSAVFCLLLWMRWVKRYHDRAAEEWPKYEKALKDAAAFLSSFESDYRELVNSNFSPCGLDLAEIGDKIKTGQFLLEKAKKLVDWEKGPSHRQTRSVEFAFKYSTAIENQRLLDTCLYDLQGPRRQLELLISNLRDRNAYLLEKRRGTCAALARQYVKRGMMHAPIICTPVARC